MGTPGIKGHKNPFEVWSLNGRLDSHKDQHTGRVFNSLHHLTWDGETKKMEKKHFLSTDNH